MSSLIWDKTKKLFVNFLGRECCDNVFGMSRGEMSIMEKMGWHQFMYPGSLIGLVSISFKVSLPPTIVYLFMPSVSYWNHEWCICQTFQIQGLFFGWSLNVDICSICFLKLFRSLLNVISSQMSSRPHYQNKTHAPVPFFSSHPAYFYSLHLWELQYLRI